MLGAYTLSQCFGVWGGLYPEPFQVLVTVLVSPPFTLYFHFTDEKAETQRKAAPMVTQLLTIRAGFNPLPSAPETEALCSAPGSLLRLC